MRCYVCGSSFFYGFEGERGVFVGQCAVCGYGYGGRPTNEVKMASWERSQWHIYQAVLLLTSGRYIYQMPVRQDRAPSCYDFEHHAPGTIVTIWDLTTRNPVTRFHVYQHFDVGCTRDDKDWMRTHWDPRKDIPNRPSYIVKVKGEAHECKDKDAIVSLLRNTPDFGLATIYGPGKECLYTNFTSTYWFEGGIA